MGQQTGMNLLQGGMSGLSRGLQQYGQRNPLQFNFANPQQGWGWQQRPPQQPAQQPQDWAGQQNIPSKIKRPGAGPADEDLFGSEQPDWTIGRMQNGG